MEKKSRGKTVTIVILILVILGLCGYIYYNMTTNNETIKSYKDDIKNLKKENKNLKNNDTNQITLDNISGTYIYKDAIEEPTCQIEITLVMKKDGTYTYSNTASCGEGVDAKGDYAIGKDKIYLYNENCKPVYDQNSDSECTYPNCSAMITIDYDGEKLLDSNTLSGKLEHLELTKR